MMVEKNGESDVRSRKVRCIAFTSWKMSKGAEAFLIRSGLKAAEKVSKKPDKRVLEKWEELLVAIGRVQSELALESAALDWSLQTEEVRDKRGRRPKDEPATYHTEWCIASCPIIDEDMAPIMAEMTAFQVLITNLPRPEKGEDESDDIREIAFPETLLKLLYPYWYKQEQKDQIGSDLRFQVGKGQRHDVRPRSGCSDSEHNRR